MIVGIDPGIQGAAAVLCPESAAGPAYIAEAIDLPTYWEADRKRRMIDGPRLYRWLNKIDASLIVIEQVGPMPADGRIAAFRFGMAVGIIHTVCRMTDIEIEYVTPQVWKDYFQLLKADKDASRRKALKLFPGAEPMLTYKMHHNRAEAMLIARWATRPVIGRDW